MFDLIQNKDDFLVISKHPGVNFHREGEDVGLLAEVRKYLEVDELFPVHRLDKDTSGLILFAKSKDAAISFATLFCEHDVDKFYVAISEKKPKRKEGAVVGDMKNSRRGTWILERTQEKPAITKYFSAPLSGNRRLYIVKPITGKTHQIRVALKSNSSAILGDSIYSNKERSKSVDRMYLHAYYLSFTYNEEKFSFFNAPSNGDFFTDDVFSKAFEKYKSPEDLNWDKLK
jgi:tRNA pseudouridine32 synthase/23S rRNA pseudouridine746 synthase